MGKTTLLRRLAEDLRTERPVGFCTEEIRERGERVGFRLTSLDGRAGVLSRVDSSSPRRIGRYGVDVPGFEAFLSVLDLTQAVSPSSSWTSSVRWSVSPTPSSAS